MDKTQISIAGTELPVYLIDTVVIGSGCAGYNAADTLYDLGRRDIAILTEGVEMGTSRNTGSDKQTFYKLSLAPDETDSVGEMAQTLFSCGGMHGDTALVEAACSVRSFMKLVNYGVAFPTDRYGAYVGYKTDHDPRKRATSAGPYTSRYMTEALENKTRHKNIRIYDKMTVVRLLVADGACAGVLAIDETRSENGGLTLIVANNTILATGGPAGAYYTSVYPESQTGMTGMAIEAGAACTNLMDWQYGLASLKFRWNVSGTYQQVLPRYITIDENGREHEFLLDYFSDPVQALNMVFMKGYQWPFDVRKIEGSSLIDIIIHHETMELGHRVYMDFRKDPTGLREQGFEALSEEAYDYLRRSNALIELPIERLAQMNSAAIDLYREHGIDLYHEPLEVGVCAQHCNGGISVDANWMSTVPQLYVAGEAAGTFGAYRPGGTALASAQTGALRAAEHIAFTTQEHTPELSAIERDPTLADFIRTVLAAMDKTAPVDTSAAFRTQRQKEMSSFAAHMRYRKQMTVLAVRRQEQTASFFEGKTVRPEMLAQLLRDRDILFTQGAMLSAMLLTADKMDSRGSGMLVDESGIPTGVGEIRYRPAKSGFEGQCIVTRYQDGEWGSAAEPVRQIPSTDTWFENVWNDYRRRTGK